MLNVRSNLSRLEYYAAKMQEIVNQSGLLYTNLSEEIRKLSKTSLSQERTCRANFRSLKKNENERRAIYDKMLSEAQTLCLSKDDNEALALAEDNELKLREDFDKVSMTFKNKLRLK